MEASAELVRDFVNTYSVEADADDLGTPAELALWLRERALTGPGDRATDDDLALAVALREGLRVALRRDGRRPELPVLPLRVTVGRRPELAPIGAGVPAGLARIAAAAAGDSWDRLKVCAEDGCQWAFVDVTRNRSRSWCSMRVCGNRTKTRAYRARKQGSRPRPGSNTDTV
ncbi:CGNR zinc finger domain-containing protein [Nonomuraea sp. MCN248]|uniref:CGNR zinc finger domain-containing protein n=1 Tax=Nonomuraea corallina TaxID=2989783 RepID=A0ABT4S9G4_9ACTN|nr:CGNR zinc finger domain-containing protein [Nonomuraea corallina]MDA0633856.1 CGNR zinc finger domain-containing protein [Nonomuraea corallina]